MGSAACARPSHDDPRVGTRLGKYRVTARLGRGGMGVVYAAVDTLLRRPAALKLLPEALSSDQAALRRFLKEAQAAARLNHPHVVSIYEIDRAEDTYYIAMELMRGGSVQDYLGAGGKLGWREATRIAADVCRGLAAAHAAGLIHRDIKPANVMRGADGAVKLADFGLATSIDQQGFSQAGAAGTPDYMSPEQCRCDALDERSDIYSLGATYYTLLTGRTAFPEASPLQVMFAHCSRPAPDPRDVDPAIPESCAAIVLRALAKERADRFSSATEMLGALDAAVGPPAVDSVSRWNEYAVSHAAAELPADESGDWLEPPAAVRKRHRRRVTAAAAGSLAVLAMIVVGVRMWPQEASNVAEPAVYESSAADLLAAATIDIPSDIAADADRWSRRLADAVSNTIQSKDRDAMERTLDEFRLFGERFPEQSKRLASLETLLRKATAFYTSITRAGLVIPLDSPATVLELSPNGRWLAVGGNEGDVGLKLWDLVSGELRAEKLLRLPPGRSHQEVMSAAFSPDGAWLAAAVRFNAGDELLIWNVADEPSMPRRIAVGDERIAAVAFCSDGAWLAAATSNEGGDDAKIRFWDHATWKELKTHDLGGPRVDALAVSPTTPARLAIVTDFEVRMCEPPSTGVTVVEAKAPCAAAAFGPQGDRLAIVGSSYVRVRSVVNDRRPDFREVPSGDAAAIAFSSDGRWLATGGGTAHSGLVTLWNLEGTQAPVVLRGHDKRVRGVRFLPRGDVVVSAGEDRTLRFWDVRHLLESNVSQGAAP